MHCIHEQSWQFCFLFLFNYCTQRSNEMRWHGMSYGSNRHNAADDIFALQFVPFFLDRNMRLIDERSVNGQDV